MRSFITTLVLVAAFVYFAPFGRIGAQGAPPAVFADIAVVPGQTIVILRDTKGSDQVIVLTFFWQDFNGIPKPILRSVTSVVAAVKDVAVSADGAPDPTRVQAVHVSLVKITDSMEWKTPEPPKPTEPK